MLQYQQNPTRVTKTGFYIFTHRGLQVWVTITVTPNGLYQLPHVLMVTYKGVRIWGKGTPYPVWVGKVGLWVQGCLQGTKPHKLY